MAWTSELIYRPFNVKNYIMTCKEEQDYMAVAAQGARRLFQYTDSFSTLVFLTTVDRMDKMHYIIIQHATKSGNKSYVMLTKDHFLELLCCYMSGQERNNMRAFTEELSAIFG